MNKPLLAVSVVALLASKGFFTTQRKWRDVIVRVPAEHLQLDSSLRAVAVPVRIVNRGEEEAISVGCPTAPLLSIERRIGGAWREHARPSQACGFADVAFRTAIVPERGVRRAMLVIRAPGRFRIRFHYHLPFDEPGSPFRMELSPAFDIAPPVSSL